MNGAEWYIIVAAAVSGISVGILLSCIVLCFCRRRFKKKKRELNLPQHRTDVDRNMTNAEANISETNTESNYVQPYEITADVNVSSYTELNTIRDVENKYQTLIK